MGFIFEEPTINQNPKPERFVFEENKVEEPSFWNDVIKKTAKDVWEGVKATPEIAATLATGAVTFPMGLIGGVSRAITTGKPSKGVKTARQIGEAFTYQPRSEAAQEAVSIIMTPFEWYNTAKDYYVDKIRKTFGEETASAADLSFDTALFLLPGMKKGIKGKFTKPMPWERGITPQDFVELNKQELMNNIEAMRNRPKKPIDTLAGRETGLNMANSFLDTLDKADRFEQYKAKELSRPIKSAKESASVFQDDINIMQSPEGRDLLLRKLKAEEGTRGKDIVRQSLVEVLEKRKQADALKEYELEEVPQPQLSGEVAKQPWEMTREDFIENYYKTDINKRVVWKGKDFTEITAKIEAKKLGNEWRIEPSPYEKERFIVTKEEPKLPLPEYKETYGKDLEIPHKQQIKKAISEGKPVPPEVLKDYPDLAKPEVGQLLEPLAKVKSEGVKGNIVQSGDKSYRLVRESTGIDDAGQWEYLYKGEWKPVISRQIRLDLNKKITKPEGVKGRTTSDIVSDIKTVLGDERGSVSGKKMTQAEIDYRAEQSRLRLEARGRLLEDAKNVGKSIDDFLADNGLSPEDIAKTSMVIPKESKEPLKGMIENLPDVQIGKKDTGIVKQTGQAISEGFHSPDAVLGKDVFGKKIYKTLDYADQAKNAFLATEGHNFTKALRGVKEGSASSVKIGQVLDGKLPVERLSPMEKGIYSFLKERFDFLLHKYARSIAGSEESYLKVINLVNKKEPAKIAVENLSSELKTKYESLKGKLSEIRGGKTLEKLNSKEKESYWNVRREMRGILEGEYIKQLPEGEKAAHDILSRQIKNYLPHILDKDFLLEEFKTELAQLKTKTDKATTQSAITNYKNRLKELETAITKLEGGQFVSYETLPRNVRFRFFETRKGKAGYSFDAIKAYKTYLNGITRKIFDEPAIRQSAIDFQSLGPSLKPYAKWYLRHYMGWDKSKLDPLAGAISSFQWMRTLGINPRSAITNLTQRLNTVAEVGVRYSIKGEKFAFTKEGKKLFDESGIAREVPQVLMEGDVIQGMERARSIVGYLFNKVELGNRKHAFLSAYLKAEAMGLKGQDALRYATDITHKTQFRYGRVGIPKVLSSPVGRVTLQFWSYPIKQVELMTDWAKHNPVKLIKYLAIAEGGNYLLNEFLGIDLSNALGFGLNYGEAIEAIKDLSTADIRGFFRHARLTYKSGGLLPSGLGPAASGLIKAASKASEGKGFQQLRKELTPIVFNRISQAYKAIKDRKEGLYPIKNNNGYIQYYLTAPELITRTVGPRTTKEGEVSLQYEKEKLLEQERKEVLHDITVAIVDNDIRTVNKLINKYQVIPSEEMITNEALKRQTTKEERRTNVSAKELYQIQREGQLARP